VLGKNLVSILIAIVAVAAVIVAMSNSAVQLQTPPHTTIQAEKTSRSISARSTTAVQASSVVLKFESYDELLSFLKNYLDYKQAKRSTKIVYLGEWALGSAVEPVASPLPAVTIPYTTATHVQEWKTEADSSLVDYSETNVQVKGVDEPDIVKTNGRIIVIASTSLKHLFILDSVNDTVIAAIPFEHAGVKGLYLVGDELVVIFEDPTVASVYTPLDLHEAGAASANTTIWIVDLSDPAKPGIRGKLEVTGFFAGSRLVDSTVYVITRIGVYEPLIPLVNGVRVPLENIIVLTDTPEAYTVITALDTTSLNYTTYAFIMPGVSWIYMTSDKLYLASEIDYELEVEKTAWRKLAEILPVEIAVEVVDCIERGEYGRAYSVIRYYLSMLSSRDIELLQRKLESSSFELQVGVTTRFYAFSVSGLNVSYTGSFEVPGRVLDQFAMERFDDYFVVATTLWNATIRVSYVIVRPVIFIPYTKPLEIVECTGNVCSTITIPSQITWYTPVFEDHLTIDFWKMFTAVIEENHVYVINATSLEVVSKLTGLAPGERVYAARLVGSILYLVTFRVVDPLFAIDLSNPTEPSVLGFLKIPGFSEYLHPVSDGFLIGVGREGPDLKISLFNVTDPTNPDEVSTIRVKYALSPVFTDHHAFTIDPVYERAYIPFSKQPYVMPELSGIIAVSYSNYTLRVVKILEHSDAVRTVYVGGKLYTISGMEVRVYDRSSLENLKSVELKS